MKPIRDRQGVAYVTTLGIASLVAVMSVGALMAVRTQGKAADATNDSNEAVNYALAGTEMARLWIKNDANWRTSYTNRVAPWTVAKKYAIGNGNFSVELVDPVDGNITNNNTDPVLVVSTGVKGAAKQKVQVRLTSSVAPLTCLKSAGVAGNGIVVNLSATLSNASNATTNKPVTSNKGISNTGTVQAPTEYVTTISGTYAKAPTKITTALQLPDPATAFDYYLSAGTSVSGSGNPITVQLLVLSPDQASLGGSRNTQGIYVLDCQNKQVIIQNCRIVGTLVVLNPGTGSVIQGSVNWKPAVKGFPCLLVKGGTIAIKIAQAKLAENTTDKVSYNPPGTPDDAGVSNDTYTDQYASGIFGLVYVNSDVSVANAATVYNLICSGTLSVSNTYYPGYDSASLDNPPPGFTAGSVVLQTGSYQKRVD
jgi:hypothetical protein